MRTIATLFAILIPAAAFAQQGNSRNSDKSPDAGRMLPSKTTTRSNPCASFGPGFVRVEGTDTCVKVGGSISVGGAVSAGGR
ncbi:hypothetical protein ACFFWD_20570 [Bradyrhizobium erythrophlei]|uniref:hypothetical protein n=1 Tax=Bradyrhizobium erythrophlei TaxID=1437360 RepID=UPI0035F0A054